MWWPKKEDKEEQECDIHSICRFFWIFKKIFLLFFSYKNIDIVWNHLLRRHRWDLVVLYPCQHHNLLLGRAQPLVTPRRFPLVVGSTMPITPMTTMPTMSPITTLVPAVYTRRTITEPRHSIRSSPFKRGQYPFPPRRRQPPRLTQVWDRHRHYYLNQYTKWVKKATPRWFVCPTPRRRSPWSRFHRTLTSHNLLLLKVGNSSSNNNNNLSHILEGPVCCISKRQR